jgi:FkbM family methyltransferase
MDLTNIDDVFKNFNQILEYFNPNSYLDIGANKGQMIEYILTQLPSLKNLEMIEACRHHKWDLEQVSNRTGFPFHIEVLSDSVKEVKFYLDTHPDRPTGPGNSYYREDTPHFVGFPGEERITTTLDIMYPDQTFDLIKLDTQGSELDIIKGGQNLVSRAKGLVIEENIVPFNIGAPLSHEIREYLEQNNFVFIKHLKWWGGWIYNAECQPMWHEEVDSLYIRKDVLESFGPLPISVGILSWKSPQSLENTLESYKKNGLFDLVDDVCIFFQEVTNDDRRLAKKYNLPFIGLKENCGIGKAFVMLCEQADNPYIMLLEDDWELIEDKKTTRERLKSAVEMLEKDISVVRLRNRKNPGYPLHSENAYKGRELEHYDPTIDLISPHLMESIHWIEFPEKSFPEQITLQNEHFVSTSRWSNWTNNPCLYRKEFYTEIVSYYAEKGLLLEPEIGRWWARQNFKVAWGEGLFTHNDIDKYGKVADE